MTVMRTKLYLSESNDPWINLALEEYMMQQVGKDEIILYLWQNDNTVVIGRNQNAWKECHLAELERENGKLARRLSGGGAVFHDMGNLNFSMILSKAYYDLPKQLSVVLQAVNRLGMDADFSGRNDLVIRERKFSGNSYCFHRDSALHHGTILVASDMGKLSRYLQVDRDKMNSKGIDSVQSRVINLTQISPSLKVGDVINSLEESFARIYGAPLTKAVVGRYDFPIEDLIQKNASWEWRFGSSPKFDVSFRHRFIWGEIELGLKLEKGHVVRANIYSDALEESLIREIAGVLVGCSYAKDRIIQRITGLEGRSAGQIIIKDLVQWLDAIDF